MILSIFCGKECLYSFETSRINALPIKGDLIEIGGNQYCVMQRLFKYEEYSSLERRQGAKGFNLKVVLMTDEENAK
ncbi:MAG: hypothetical protein DRR16_15500 [Candidatus Parabeggiatoa sp. nov. 3]|nr:MAG: hypothetical protein DRR00_32825 [Gammaproteobacteria bacterium]RKZ52978.1 MAG: hypothetical protein DRQ99_32105 [Gammaproteobacteria bacterium]RKZ84156.1 MAG: hypothetical protein DRR16_15500 [Gammaproteobacteria bacterium]HEW98628.1 hypothetical protein [Beggiatoa sp.]